MDLLNNVDQQAGGQLGEVLLSVGVCVSGHADLAKIQVDRQTTNSTTLILKVAQQMRLSGASTTEQDLMFTGLQLCQQRWHRHECVPQNTLGCILSAAGHSLQEVVQLSTGQGVHPPVHNSD
jgi:hypothetical protein